MEEDDRRGEIDDEQPSKSIDSNINVTSNENNDDFNDEKKKDKKKHKHKKEKKDKKEKKEHRDRDSMDKTHSRSRHRSRSDERRRHRSRSDERRRYRSRSGDRRRNRSRSGDRRRYRSRSGDRRRYRSRSDERRRYRSGSDERRRHRSRSDERRRHRSRSRDRRRYQDDRHDASLDEKHRTRSQSSEHGKKRSDVSKSPKKSLERSSSQGRDYLKGRDGHGARGISPASIATRKIDVPVTSTANAAPKRFWDGFQWVERTNAPVSGAPDDVTSIANQTRQERRLYVGNLLPSCNDQMLTDFMNACMESCLSGAGISLPEGYTKAVLSVWIAPSQNYAFVEFVTKECALIAMGLTGIEFMGMQLKISRPNNYAYHGSIQSGSLAAETSALLATAMGQQPAAIASTPTWNFTSQPVLNTQTSAEPTPVLATTAPAEQPASLVAGRRDNRPAWMTASNPTS